MIGVPVGFVVELACEWRPFELKYRPFDVCLNEVGVDGLKGRGQRFHDLTLHEFFLWCKMSPDAACKALTPREFLIWCKN